MDIIHRNSNTNCEPLSPQASMRDMELDVPGAPGYFSEYVEAATHDGLLPEDFLVASAVRHVPGILRSESC